MYDNKTRNTRRKMKRNFLNIKEGFFNYSNFQIYKSIQVKDLNLI